MSLGDFRPEGEAVRYLSFGYEILLLAWDSSPLSALELIVKWLREKIIFDKARAEAVLWLEQPENRSICSTGGVNVFLFRQQPPSGLTGALRSELKKYADENRISAVLSRDSREPELLTLYRTDFGHEILDFSRCRPANPVFVHQGGFLMKFISREQDEWKVLVGEAVVQGNAGEGIQPE